MYVGVDGYKSGWVSVSITSKGPLDARTFSDFDELVVHYAEATVIGVDMPIGLLSTSSRCADRAARAYLKGQASSVFNAPAREALAASSYEEACHLSLEACGLKMSRQSYALFDKIRQVDAHVDNSRVFEVHPELAFRILNGDAELAYRKKTWGGLRSRLALLRAAGINPEALSGEVDTVPIDDVVDAAVAAWSARRIGQDQARRFPADEVERDQSKREIAIWA